MNEEYLRFLDLMEQRTQTGKLSPEDGKWLADRMKDKAFTEGYQKALPEILKAKNAQNLLAQQTQAKLERGVAAARKAEATKPQIVQAGVVPQGAQQNPEQQRQAMLAAFADSPEAQQIILNGGSIQDAEAARLGAQSRPAPVSAEPQMNKSLVSAAIPPEEVAPQNVPQEGQAVPSPTATAVEGTPIDVQKKKGIGEKIKGLYTKFGVPILGIAETFMKAYGNNPTPTYFDKKREESMLEKERAYVQKLQEAQRAADKLEREQERAYEAKQRKLEWENQRQMLREEYGLREGLAKKEAAAKKPAVTPEVRYGQ